MNIQLYLSGKGKLRYRTDAADRYPMSEGIKIHRITGLDIYRQVFMFWMKDRYRLPAVERFIEYMKEQQADDANDTENAISKFI